MAVRNFWVDGYIDGRETRLGGGPRSKDGGMRVELFQRENGGITTALKVECTAERDGTLVTTVLDEEDNLIFEKKTTR